MIGESENMRRCSKCEEKSILYQRYSGMDLCKSHLKNSIEKKVKNYFRENCRIRKNDTIAVALSGGKDSSVLLYIIKDIFGEWPNLDIYTISIDEGIGKYRNESLEKAKSLSESLGIENHIYTFKEELGVSLDEIAEIDKNERACSYCGILRRWILNKSSKEVGADWLAVGHNLDDESQSALMSFLDGEVENIASLGGKPTKLKGFTPRIKPLRKIPEKEIALYAKINRDIGAHFDECPYSYQALRQEVRSMLNKYERGHPGTKYSILSTIDKIAPILSEEINSLELDECSCCGEPSKNDKCRTCELITDILEVESHM